MKPVPTFAGAQVPAPAPAPVTAGRLLDSLPAVYREADAADGDGDLQALLAALEAGLIGAPGSATAEGLEQRIDALPSLLAPQGLSERPQAAVPAFDPATRDAFVPWIAAAWVAFTPFAHFDADRLRRIVGGIVPLYARRGTGAYLTALLHLCFDEIADVALHEDVTGGLLVGRARVGTSSQLGAERAFTFRLDVQLRPNHGGWGPQALAPLRAALQAVVDFAKPAHTCCELHLALPPLPSGRDGVFP